MLMFESCFLYSYAADLLVECVELCFQQVQVLNSASARLLLVINYFLS